MSLASRLSFLGPWLGISTGLNEQSRIVRGKIRVGRGHDGTPETFVKLNAQSLIAAAFMACTTTTPVRR